MRRFEHNICVEVKVEAVNSRGTSTDTTHLTSVCSVLCQNEVQAMYRLNISPHFNRQHTLSI
jgi:hypothetical protein